MAIDVEVFGQLLPDQPRRRSMDVEEPKTARELSESIGLHAEEIGLVMIDGVQSSLDAQVKSGSRLCFFPYVTGG